MVEEKVRLARVCFGERWHNSPSDKSLRSVLNDFQLRKFSMYKNPKKIAQGRNDFHRSISHQDVSGCLISLSSNLHFCTLLWWVSVLTISIGRSSVSVETSRRKYCPLQHFSKGLFQIYLCDSVGRHKYRNWHRVAYIHESGDFNLKKVGGRYHSGISSTSNFYLGDKFLLPHENIRTPGLEPNRTCYEYVEESCQSPGLCHVDIHEAGGRVHRGVG